MPKRQAQTIRRHADHDRTGHFPAHTTPGRVGERRHAAPRTSHPCTRYKPRPTAVSSPHNPISHALTGYLGLLPTRGTPCRLAHVKGHTLPGPATKPTMTRAQRPGTTRKEDGMAGRRCTTCPTILTNGQRQCTTCKREADKARGTREQRGYGKQHQTLRREWQTRINQGGTNCARCGKPITPNSNWHLGHTDNRQTYLGPEHAQCNLSAAGKQSHKTF